MEPSDKYIVYVLRSVQDGKRYIGFTTNLARRLDAHNRGETPSTKYRKPFTVIYSEQVLNRSEARERERYLKTAAGCRWLQKELNKQQEC